MIKELSDYQHLQTQRLSDPLTAWQLLVMTARSGHLKSRARLRMFDMQ